MKLVNGTDLIPEDLGESLFVLTPTEAKDGTGWALVLGWIMPAGEGGKYMAATMLTTNTERDKLQALYDGLGKLLDEQEERCGRLATRL